MWIADNLNEFKDGLKESVKEGINESISGLWHGFLNVFSNGIDAFALIAIMVTWLLHIMSVPNAGKWCYIIFAFYIVIKIILKALLMI
jgi:hypothetical protein